VNDKPVARDDYASTPENTPVNIAVKNNDTDIEGPLTGNPVVLDQPDHGTVVVNNDGTITYTPDDGYVGNDTFTYIICDGGTPDLCDTATVIITVTAVNRPPVANNDTITTPEDNSVNINVLVNDIDPNGNLNPNPTILTNPAHGRVVVNADGTITYIPDPDYNGTDSFSYIICDSLGLCDTAEVYITVTPVEDLCYWLKGISPNGDGQNDAFWVNCNDEFPKATISIFNRWGDEVFRSNGHYNNDWRGVNQVEKDLPDGTYYYIYEFNDGIHKAHAGYITVNR
jgi:gliding motility-associated-like protein